MSRTENQKTRIFQILRILKAKTDDDHQISTAQLISFLKSEGIEAERKTVLDDLRTLEDAGYDVERMRGKNGGVRLLQGEFETAELKMLIDAVASAHFISEKRSKKLIDKLCSFSSDYQKTALKRHIYMGNKQKSENPALLYSVDAINEAIERGRKITFYYTDRGLDKRSYRRRGGSAYCVSPWELTIYDNNYYLIAYVSEEKTLRHYRVDKMEETTVSEEAAEGREKTGDLNLNDYCSPIFGMFGGEHVGVTIEAPAKLVGVFIDRFGAEIRVTPCKEGACFTTHVDVTVSPPFFGWLVSLGAGVRILSPDDVRQSYERALREALG